MLNTETEPVVKCAELLAVDWVPEAQCYLITKSYPDINLVCWFFIPAIEGKQWLALL